MNIPGIFTVQKPPSTLCIGGICTGVENFKLDINDQRLLNMISFGKRVLALNPERCWPLRVNSSLQNEMPLGINHGGNPPRVHLILIVFFGNLKV